jgi:hypothetical protein
MERKRSRPPAWRRIGLAQGVAALAVFALVAAFAAQAPARRFVGGPRADRVTGTARADRILLGRGNDLARARGGRDFVRGDAGNDVIHGGGAADRLFGGAGRDWLYGDAGNDRERGGPGADVVLGGAGADRLLGESGGDFLTGGAGADYFLGGAGNDVLNARDGRRDARVDGGPGKDTCVLDRADLAVARSCEVSMSGPSSLGSGGGGGGGGGGVGGTRQIPFSLVSAQGTSCTVALPCTLLLAGVGAKNGSVGTQLGSGLLGSALASVNADGTWLVSGSYSCLQNSNVTLTSGVEQIVVATTCLLLPGGGGGVDHGPLTITQASGTACSPLTLSCTFSLAGTGAEGSTVTVLGVPGAVVLTSSSTVNPDGSWSATGTWKCATAGQIQVVDGQVEVPLETASTATTC